MGPKICHICPCMQRGAAVHLVVWHHRHMAADAAYRIAQGSAILNFQPFHRVTLPAEKSLRGERDGMDGGERGSEDRAGGLVSRAQRCQRHIYEIAEYLMVRRHGHMRAHAAYRIAQ